MSTAEPMDTEAEVQPVNTTALLLNGQAEDAGPSKGGLDLGKKSCRRLALLHDAFSKVMDYGLRDLSREEFGRQFSKLDGALVDALYDVYRQAMGLARQQSKEGMAELCSEHHVDQQLRDLDAAEAAGQTPPPPSTSAAASAPATPLQQHLRQSLNGMVFTPRRAGAAPASAAVAQRAEEAAQLHALRQEELFLKEQLERARATEARLRETVAQRKAALERAKATYGAAVTEVKDVYNITRVMAA